MVMLIGSCTDKKTSRAELTFNKVIANDLFVMFPGTMRVTTNHFIVQNPFNRDAFLLVYDRHTGEEKLSTGIIGSGPGEWNNPDISNVIGDRFAIYDGNLKKFVLVGIDSIDNISNPEYQQKINADISKFVFLNEHQWIVANWKETHPFDFISNGQIYPCGQYPMEETVKNVAECFQGTIQIHPEKKLLVYATFSNPYISLYKVDDEKLNLVWENQFKLPQYTVNDDALHWGKDQPDGVSDVTFTKDYIVCLVKDFKSDAQGRDVKAAPKAVYVFNYKGKLIHIFDLPVHSIRLASDTETNKFYSIGLEPNYSIVEYDLSISSQN